MRYFSAFFVLSFGAVVAGCSHQMTAQTVPVESQNSSVAPSPSSRLSRARQPRASGTERVLHSFMGPPDGSQPVAGLTVLNGMFYGTTSGGGTSYGTVFQLSPSGEESVLYRFKGGKDGSSPYASLTVLNGNLYGTTYYGGGRWCPDELTRQLSGCGTVFEVSPSGAERVLHGFTGFKRKKDGANPQGGLIAVDGELYGTTLNGGGGKGCLPAYGSSPTGCGAVFEVTTSGAERVIHSFGMGTNTLSTDGANPEGALVEVGGRLYGTTYVGGTPTAAGDQANGIVFSLQTSGSNFQVIHTFEPGSGDGAQPETGLTAVNRVLYGTTSLGGADLIECGDAGLKGPCGTIFVLTPSGSGYKESVLYSFRGGKDGFNPSSLIEMNGALYGTTQTGGKGCPQYDQREVVGCGTVFEVSTAGHENVIYSFEGPPDGNIPVGLTELNRRLYGMTRYGGTGACLPLHLPCGTIFEVTP